MHRPLSPGALRLAAVPALLAAGAAGAQPRPGADAELAAVHAAPASAWHALIRSDTVVVEGFTAADPAQPVYWTRARYSSPRRFGGAPYDVRLARYAADCAAGETRLTRMVWLSGGVATADTTLVRNADPAAPGTIARGMLSRACASVPAPDVAALLALPEARWTDVAAGQTDRRHADFGGATREGAHHLVWLRAVFATPQRAAFGEYDRQYQRWEVDCSTSRARLQRLAVLLGNRALADSVLPQPWTQPRAGTSVRAIVDRLCATALLPGGEPRAPRRPHQGRAPTPFSRSPGMDQLRGPFAGMMSGLDVHRGPGEGHPLPGRRMPG